MNSRVSSQKARALPFSSPLELLAVLTLVLGTWSLCQYYISGGSLVSASTPRTLSAYLTSPSGVQPHSTRVTGSMPSASSSSSPPKHRLADYVAPYPDPTAEQRRYVVYLEPKEKEISDYRVELIPGRVEQVDGSNQYFLGGSVEEKVVEGWGYTYHVVTLGPTASTRMMPLGDDAVMRPRFVAMHSDKLFVRYNSKLPIVVYTPKDAELHFRIWSAQDEGSSHVAHEE